MSTYSAHVSYVGIGVYVTYISNMKSEYISVRHGLRGERRKL